MKAVDDRQPEEDRAVDLFRRAVEGDGHAWTELYGMQEAHMRKVVSKRIPTALRPGIATEEIVQSAFFELTQHGAGLEISHAGDLRAWLAHVLRNKLRDRIRSETASKRGGGMQRRAATEEILQHPAKGPSLEELVQRAEVLNRMYDRIRELEPADQELVLLRFASGETWEFIAKRTGLAVTTAKKRYSELVDQMVRGFA